MRPDELLALMPHAAVIGIQLVEATPSSVTGKLDWSPDLCTAGGGMHGGAIMTLADSVGAVCAYLNLPPATTTATIESKTNFLRGLHSGTLQAQAQPLHVGRSVIVVQSELTDGQGRRIAHTIQTQAVTLAPAPISGSQRAKRPG